MPFTILKPCFLSLMLLIPVGWIFLFKYMKHPYLFGDKRFIGSLKTLLIIFLALAFSDIRLKEPIDMMNLFFCIDVSQSCQNMQMSDKNKIQGFMNKILDRMDKKDRAGIIVFGKEAYVETELTDQLSLGQIKAAPDDDRTNIEKGIQSALGKFPPSGDNKIILFSDGNQNLGNALDAATLSKSLGVEIWPVPLSSWFKDNEVYIEKLETPQSIASHTPFAVRTIITSTHDPEGELIIIRNNQVLLKKRVSLNPGKNSFVFSDVIEDSGLHVYKAIVNTPGDTIFENNEYLSFTKSLRKSEILIISQDVSSPFARALETQGLKVSTMTPPFFPGSLNELLNFRAIVVDNIPATQFSLANLGQMETYVQDAGGGLIMLGGEYGFGAGFYIDTPLENVLPVFMDHPTTLEKPEFCLLILVDKSSSMAGYIKNNSKLEGAKIASFSAVEMLNPFDQVGILAFDTKYQWVVPIMPAKDRDTIARALSRLTELGGTDLYPALHHAFETLKAVDAQKKHVIILSDGKTKEADFRFLIKNMQKENISISTVAVGDGSDRKLMKKIAQWGRGRTYYTNDADKMPRIFAGDTKIASQSTIIEGEIPASSDRQSELMTGIPLDTLPISEGIVVTYPKPGSQVIFNTEHGPLFSSWQYGLGRSIAFTGGFTGKWGKQWVEWAHFEKMASQMVRWVQKSDPKTNYHVTITNKNDLGQFNVDVIDNNAMFVNHASLNLNILYPSKEKTSLNLSQAAPGRYLANFNTHETGEYYLTLHGDSKKEDLPTQTFCFGVPYSKEYTSRGVNTGLMKLIAQKTNGRLLDIDQTPTQVFNQRKRTMGAGKPIWVYFILLFTLVFMIEVAIRKIIELKKTRVYLR